LADRLDYPRWPVAAAVVASIVLYVALPSELIPQAPVIRFLVPGMQILLIAILTIDAPRQMLLNAGLRRHVSIALIAVISIGNAIALGLLLHQLLYGGSVSGRTLLFASFDIWATNVIAFSLWYWELDGGGPVARLKDPDGERDFAFVQQTSPDLRTPGWMPDYFDYLYLGFTNSIAFSPTDTMPLTRMAKLLMLFQSALSAVTILLVAARAVNILNS
jgi:uncharacterized membrane protein